MTYSFVEIDQKLAEMEKNVKELVQVTSETRKEADEARKEVHELWWTEVLRRKSERVYGGL
jgi:exoribonuclease R